MTWKNCSTPFLSSISLIFFLTSIPLALSSARIGGWTWMIRHWGSAVGSWGIAQVGVGLGCFRLLVWLGLGGDAVTWAHDLGSFAAIGVAFVLRSCSCGCVVWEAFASSSFSFLVRYALVSARYAMVGSAGFFRSASSANSIRLFSQFLKNPILFQVRVFLLILSSLAISRISLSRLLTLTSSISSSCLCWSFRYLLYALSISSWVICCSISSMCASLVSGVGLWSRSCGLSLCVSTSGGCGMLIPFMTFSGDSNQSPSILGLFLVCGDLAGT